MRKPNFRAVGRSAITIALAAILIAPFEAAAERAGPPTVGWAAAESPPAPELRLAQRQRQQRQPAQTERGQRQQQPAEPGAIETSARQAIIVDFATGAVLYEKNADERMPPSSMSKIMTGYMVFKALKEGRVQLDSMLPVSEKAWRMQGSKMFVMIGSQVKVEDLLRGMIVQSGNDACIALAEGLSGSEAAFAEQMNAEARRIGLTASNFRNASGWPDPEHYTTARDLAILSKRLITDFPDYYKYYAELEFTYGTDDRGKPIRQGNRNPLLYKSTGADGLKTGHTEEAGYGLTASAVREGRRTIMVFNGWPSMRVRAEESERMLEWAYREFTGYRLFAAGQTVEKADVWLGEQATVPLTVKTDAVAVISRRARPQMQVTVVYDGPIPAPVIKGTTVGKLVVSFPGVTPLEYPLVAGEDVGRLGALGRLASAVGHLIFGGGWK